jgi:type II secretory pathway pseudopilin PulG
MRRSLNIPMRPQGGFTLLELLVATLLAVAVGAMTAQLWRNVSMQTDDLSHRATAAQELKFALESLRGDMGSYVWAMRVSASRLMIRRYTVSGEEALVEYYPSGSNLCRYDHLTGIVIPIAAHVSSFTVDDLGGSVLQVVVTVTCGLTERQATILWSTS